MKNPVPFLRRIALAEAVSYLALLLVAMPLKYLLNVPQAVMAVGWVHGLLFILFCASLLHTFVLARWPVLRVAMVFVASLLPFVPFFLDRKMRGYEEEYQPQGTGA
ncbi:DUF3817 domain-containing protein [Phragmitibacter flavus]|uniref:DUF3817 domain-containing protein n=1 Tax=Phragmitibacter flavus TaxID=2576071 RepID=A0A5R8KK17_9BACT|nr:DUF3817 domain-containing protein [Phragmitibacter flavus]TLD72666.1 DUF3817 domain-containing protein [Phragmitibacter flavus]